jgi:2-amino-4-hydroxy-6-hydroxymethyldihydropteridine diphosphokinase
MNYVIGIGGNEGDVPKTFKEVFLRISSHLGAIKRTSKWYYSKPLPVEGGKFQQEYLNAVFLLESTLEPESVLTELLSIEKYFGRDRSKSYYWGPRTLDLDIIASDIGVYHSDRLDIPHPRMHQRDFVLKPFLEIEPDWNHPETKKSLEVMYSELPLEDRYIVREHIPT